MDGGERIRRCPAAKVTDMDAALFQRFSDLAYRQAGLSLGAGKEALVEARVAKRQRALGIDNPRDYLHFLESGQSPDELLHFLDAISTNFTSFFREKPHFDFFAEAVRHWMAGGQSRFKFWSAASSTGEEPYSMAMTILSECRPPGASDWGAPEFKILATDLSCQVLERAKQGRYTEQAIRSVPEALRLAYFAKVGGERGSEPEYVAGPLLRERIVFKRLNLAAGRFPMQGPLDLIFCRNVMIYFDQSVRQRLVAECERLLRPGGYLLTGHSETLTGIATGLETVGPSIYRKEAEG